MDIKHICTNCDYRHGGCSLRYDDFKQMLENNTECQNFLLGKCFYCAMYALEDTTLCPSYIDVDGCDNFKPANNYDEYLKLKRAFDDDDARLTEEMLYHNQLDRLKVKDRRSKDRNYHSRQLKKAKNAGGHHPGLYYDEEAGRVKIWERGNRSKWLKGLAHRKVRRKRIDNDLLYQRGQYKKLFDYWWELY